MKSVVAGLLFTFVCLSSAISLAQQNPILVKVGFQTAYVPKGFDDNDRIQVTIEGFFRDSCYRVGPYSVKIEGSKVLITEMAYFYQGVICLDMIVPYHQTVELGIVKAGNYSIVDATSGTTLGFLPVAVAKTSSPDDYLYAPVSDATVLNSENQATVVISGVFPNNCMKMQEVKTRVVDNVIEVLPIAEKLAGPCQNGFHPYQQQIQINKPSMGRYLLHVRSLEGQAVNKLVDVF